MYNKQIHLIHIDLFVNIFRCIFLVPLIHPKRFFVHNFRYINSVYYTINCNFMILKCQVYLFIDIKYKKNEKRIISMIIFSIYRS